MTWRDCDVCLDFATANYDRLRGACASVGIEHDTDTDTMLDRFMAHHHRDHQETTPCP